MSTQLTQPIIETITAEISVVKIGNKQMTISVFNQLYTEDCWDEKFNILYPIWGKANRDEEYVIFQKGNELRKCRIPHKRIKDDFNESLYHYLRFRRKLFNYPSDNTDENYEGKRLLYYISQADRYWTVKDVNFESALKVLDEIYKIEHQQLFEKSNWKVEKINQMIEQLQSVRQLFIAI